ncbi:hypothetical protein [Micromonospora humida]|uniref:hypothetical protein n=1 Tax=Micromonospora humida TaxID=2809018 RepID=UPI00343C4642
MADESTIWGTICRDFHDIRLGANRNDLVSEWQRLVRDCRDDRPDLAGWQALDREIRLRDDTADDSSLRYPDEESDDDDADEADEFVCPKSQCSRVEPRLYLGEAPRCELFNRRMKPAVTG